MTVEIVSSAGRKPTRLKLLFWGESGSRKTESILRYFPDVLMIDTEGNAQQCFGMPDIPEFLLAATKDPEEVIATIDRVAAGKIKFPDGRPVQTVAIDSATVLWNVRKDTRALVVEKRIAKWGKSAEEASMTQLDWSMAKRPLARLNTRLANCPIKYVIFTGRLADKYQEGAKDGDMKKVGERADVVKGLDYDMNLSIRMNKPDATKGTGWSCTIDKTQGDIGRILPLGKTFDKFPIAEIIKHTSGYKPEQAHVPGEDEVAERAAEIESVAEPVAAKPVDTLPVQAPAAQPASIDEFYAEALALGYATPDNEPDRQRVRAVLKSHGFTTFVVADAQKYINALRDAIAKPQAAGQ